MTGLIKAIRIEKGKVHDFQIYKNSKFDLSEALAIKADSGFQGIEREHNNSQIPHKASKLNPLTDRQKQENKELASERVPVEHSNRKCKIFKICGSRFRGKHQNYDSTWLLVAAIVNLKISTQNLRYATP